MEDSSLIKIEPKRKLSTFVIPDNTHFIRHFLNNKYKKNEHTAKSYEIDIKEFFKVNMVEDISLNDIKAVTVFDVEDYIIGLIDLGRASSTIHRKVSSLSSLYKWLLKYQDNSRNISLIQFNPFNNMSDVKPTLTHDDTEFLSRDEAALLLNSIGTESITDLRNKTIIGLALITGARKSEILNIKLKHITNVLGYDVIRVTRKRGKKDLIKINTHVKDLIMDYINRTGRSIEANQEDYLFIGHSSNKQNGEKLNPATFNKIISNYCCKFNINKKIKVHSLRHTAITIAIQKGASLEKVQAFAGHESAYTTARYVHSINKLQDNAGDLIDVFED